VNVTFIRERITMKGAPGFAGWKEQERTTAAFEIFQDWNETHL
jgi:hypothetical protein